MYPDHEHTEPTTGCAARHSGSRAASWQAMNADLQSVDELSASVFRSFMNVLHLHKHYMFKAMSAHGAHPGQAICLRILGTHDGITQCDLADALHVTRPTITKMLQAMEKDGIVERRPDEHDQRLMHVHLTPAGAERSADVFKAAADYINRTIAKLSEADRRELVRLLDAMAVGLADAAAAADEPAGERSPQATHDADAGGAAARDAADDADASGTTAGEPA